MQNPFACRCVPRETPTAALDAATASVGQDWGQLPAYRTHSGRCCASDRRAALLAAGCFAGGTLTPLPASVFPQAGSVELRQACRLLSSLAGAALLLRLVQVGACPQGWRGAAGHRLALVVYVLSSSSCRRCAAPSHRGVAVTFTDKKNDNWPTSRCVVCMCMRLGACAAPWWSAARCAGQFVIHH